MDSAYLNLVRGNRLSSYMGLKMEDGYEYKYGKSYQYVEIPAFTVLGSEDGVSIKRNQHVWIAAAASIDVKGSSFVEVEPCPELAEYGQVQGMYRIHPESGRKQVGFWFTARRDVNLSDIKYAVRLYMPT